MANLFSRYAKVQSHGHRCQHVVEVVAADEVGRHFVPITVMFPPLQAQERVAGDNLAKDTGITLALVAGIALGLDVTGQDAHQVLVVGVDKDDAALAAGEVVIEFALGVDNALQRSKSQQVGLAHISNKAAGGLGSLGERLDVTWMAGAHLNDGDLVLGSEAQQRLGHAHIVVEVALGSHHIIFLGKDGTHQFLGRRLAVSAGDADDRDVKLASVFPGQVLEGLQGIGDKHHGLVAMVVVIYLLVVDHGQGAALVERLGCKLVAVKRFAF